jgi:DNA-directed RNA polymerase specialized sigma subunit
MRTITREQKEKELELWRTWKQTQDKELLNQLLNTFNPIIQREVNKWTGNLPREFIEAEAKRLAVNAFKTYSPKKGALTTHLVNQLKPLSRYVYTYQNIVRIPSEERIRKITMFKNAIDDLEASLGRPPSVDEIADYLKWNKKEIHKLMKELRPELVSTFEFAKEPVYYDERTKRILTAIYYDLPPRDRAIFEYLTGYNGRQIMSVEKLAKKFNVPRSYIEDLKNRIKKELKTMRI